MIRLTAIDRRVVALAVPAAGSAMLQVVHRAVDMYWVGHLGTDALASLSLSAITVWMYAALGTLVGTGLTALVARYVGAGRRDGGRYVAAQGLAWSIGIGAVAAAGGWLLAPEIFTATKATPSVREAGEAYTRIFWGGGALVLLQQAGDAVFRGHGNTRFPFLAALVALVVNVVLDPLFIHGLGPVPALGVPGAAWATLVATAVAVLLLVHRLRKLHHLAWARPPDASLRLVASTPLGRAGPGGLDPVLLWRMVRVGVPIAAGGLFFTVILLALQRIAGEAGGSAAQAGLGIGHTGEGVAYVLAMGWGAAASAVVGQSLGAARPTAAARGAWRAALQCSVLCFAWGCVLFVFADEIALFLTTKQTGDAAARAYAASYFRIVSVCLVPQAVGIVVEGAFGGAGLTVPPMLVSTFFSLVRIPLAWLAAFPLGMGVEGIWWTITVTAVLHGVVNALYFARGTWKTQSV